MLYAIGDGGEVLTVAVAREHSDLVVKRIAVFSDEGRDGLRQTSAAGACSTRLCSATT